jgi:hypothetical protein
VPAAKPFFSTYLPQVFGSLTTLNTTKNSATKDSDFLAHSQSKVKHNEAVLSESGEELLDMEKAQHIQRPRSWIRPKRAATVTLVASRGESKVCAEDANFIRITQVVDVMKEHV